MSRVDLWTFPLDAPAEGIDGLDALLSLDERARAARFVYPVHASRFVVAHGRLRQILGRVTGTDPATLMLVTDRHGKPGLPDTPVHFSLSHSETFGAVAVAPFPVGVDVEAVRDIPPGEVERFFSAAERDGLGSLPDAAWLPAFLRCWTRKEAVCKAAGLGLGMPLDSFSVTFRADDPPGLTWMHGEPAAASMWQLRHFDIVTACVGAIAARETGWTVDRQS